MIWVYIRLYLMFFLRTIMIKIGIEITFYITSTFNMWVRGIYNDGIISLPPSEYVSLISFGVAVLLALKTTYIIDGKRGKIYGDEFGFDPEKHKR
jgi:hypothetical protein